MSATTSSTTTSGSSSDTVYIASSSSSSSSSSSNGSSSSGGSSGSDGSSSSRESRRAAAAAILSRKVWQKSARPSVSNFADWQLRKATDHRCVIVNTACGMNPLLHAAFNFIYLRGRQVKNLFRPPDTRQEHAQWSLTAKKLSDSFAQGGDYCELRLQHISHLDNEGQVHVVCQMVKQRLELRQDSKLKRAEVHEKLEAATAKCVSDGLGKARYAIGALPMSKQRSINDLVSALLNTGSARDLSLLAHLVTLVRVAEAGVDAGCLGASLFGTKSRAPSFATKILSVLSNANTTLPLDHTGDSECWRLPAKQFGVSLASQFAWASEGSLRLPGLLEFCLAFIRFCMRRKPCHLPMNMRHRGRRLAAFVACELECGAHLWQVRLHLTPAAAYQLVLFYFRNLPERQEVAPNSVLSCEEISAMDMLAQIPIPRRRILGHLALALSEVAKNYRVTHLTSQRLSRQLAAALCSSKRHTTAVRKFLRTLIDSADLLPEDATHCGVNCWQLYTKS